MSDLANNAQLSIAAYCFASISMTVVNKYVVSGSSWDMTFFYLAVQSIICIITILTCKSLGFIRNLAPFDVEKGKRWFPISLLLVGMIYTGTKALQFLSVPVFTIFKNLTIVAIAYGEKYTFGTSVTPLTLVSFALMVFSSLIAAWADIRYVLAGHAGDTASNMSTLNAGYMWMGLNVFCAASFSLGMRKYGKNFGFSDWDTMFYNNLLTIPVLVGASLLTEDWSAANFAKNFPEDSRNRIIAGMVYSGLGAALISYCTAWCVRVTSSTTYSMVGALNKLPIAIAGIVFFSAPVTVGSVSAIFLGFVSGIIYAIAKVKGSGGPKPSVLPTQSAPNGSGFKGS